MIVETHHVAKRFGRFEAIEDLNLSVPEGAVFALIGPNGAGKTTTIRMLMNILRPDRGDITVLGTPSRRLGPDDFQRIGYVSESQRLPERLTLAQYFDYLRSLYPAWDRALETQLCRAIRAAADAQDQTPLARHAHEGAARGRAGLPPQTTGAGRAAERPRHAGARRSRERPAAAGGRHHHPDLLARAREIETFTTHVAFMQNGRLLLQEAIETCGALPRGVGDAVGGEGTAAAAARRAGCCRKSKGTGCDSSRRTTGTTTSLYRELDAALRRGARWNASRCRCARSRTR